MDPADTISKVERMLLFHHNFDRRAWVGAAHRFDADGRECSRARLEEQEEPRRVRPSTRRRGRRHPPPLPRQQIVHLKAHRSPLTALELVSQRSQRAGRFGPYGIGVQNVLLLPWVSLEVDQHLARGRRPIAYRHTVGVMKADVLPLPTPDRGGAPRLEHEPGIAAEEPAGIFVGISGFHESHETHPVDPIPNGHRQIDVGQLDQRECRLNPSLF